MLSPLPQSGLPSADDKRPASERPILTNRNSASECAGSGIITSSVSFNTVIASAKLMPCLDRFEAALPASHSNSTTQSYGGRLLEDSGFGRDVVAGSADPLNAKRLRGSNPTRWLSAGAGAPARAGGPASASGSGTRASRAVQGDRPTKALPERLPESGR